MNSEMINSLDNLVTSKMSKNPAGSPTKFSANYYPTHESVNNWQFPDGELEEAALCSVLAAVAEKNGVSINSLLHLFPAILKMLNSKSAWTK